ncbi:MAG: hypothetical protein M3Q75_14655 [Gemmatimonadota bacterium]|nr:hypothetical protein [Gemmatimonadota bacterium]
MTLTIIAVLGVSLNLAGAGCSAAALVQSHERHGHGPIEPWLALWSNRVVAAWQRHVLRRPRRTVVGASHSTTLDIAGTGAASVTLHVGFPAHRSVEHQVAWLHDRITDLQARAEQDRSAHRAAVTALSDEVTAHVAQIDDRLSTLDETTSEIGAGTVRLQLRGLALVVLGTVLSIIPTVIR